MKSKNRISVFFATFFVAVLSNNSVAHSFLLSAVLNKWKSPNNNSSSETTSSFLEDPGHEGYALQPPHAGCHFRPTHPATPSNHKGQRKYKRFFEGWYYRITLPQENASFAFIFSLEDPFMGSNLSLACHQAMGPNEVDYLVQADRDHSKFWAWYHQQALGCVYNVTKDSTISSNETTAMTAEEFCTNVESGFQMLSNRLQGKLVGHDGSRGGVLHGQGVEGECSYDMTIKPIAGWGDKESGQKSTAGWLASYAVFEPHWQVTMADGRATGSIVWKGKKYEFVDAPFYAEKNWGGTFPEKWYWCQCNSFEGYTQDGRSLSVTAGGGIRQIPLGQKESLGMVSVHYNGRFYEATPWMGTMEWDVSPWGYWKLTGRSTAGPYPFEVELEAVCDTPGVKLRAPCDQGMVYLCRDSFHGNIQLTLWELQWDETKKQYVRGSLILDKASSTQAAVEVGGGPWHERWKGRSVMKQPMKGLVRFPFRLANWRKKMFNTK